jgi:hypothetical protein
VTAGDLVVELTAEAEAELRLAGRAGDPVGGLEAFLHRRGATLHPGHHLMLTASMRLGCLYGHWPKGGTGPMGLPRPLLERKVGY